MKKFVLLLLTVSIINLFANNTKPLFVEVKNKGGVKFLNTPVLNHVNFIDNSNKTNMLIKKNICIDDSFNSHIFELLNIRNFPDAKAIVSLSAGCGNFAIFKTSLRADKNGFVILFNTFNKTLCKQIKPNFDFTYPYITEIIFPNRHTLSLLILDKLHTYRITDKEIIFKSKSLLPLPQIKFPNYKLYMENNFLIVFNSTYTVFNSNVPLLFIYKFSENSYTFEKSIYFDRQLTKQVAGILWEIHNNKPLPEIEYRNELISEAEENFFIKGFESGDFYYFNQVNKLLIKGNWQRREIDVHTALKRLSHLSIVQVLGNPYTKEIFILIKPIKGKQEIIVLSSNLTYKKTYVVNNKLKDKLMYIHKIQFIDKNSMFIGVYEKGRNTKSKYSIYKAKLCD